MVKPPVSPRLPVFDWQLPLRHFARVREEIEDAALHVSQSGAENALMIDVRPLEHRYAVGERSQALYEAMLATKFK